MLKTILAVVPLTFVVVVSCGGSDSEFHGAGNGGSAGAMSSGGKENGAGSGNQAGSSMSSAGTKSNGGDTSGGGTGNQAGINGTSGGEPSGAGGDVVGIAGEAAGGAVGAGGGGSDAPCPDLFGDYTIQSAQGTCGTLNVDAPQAIAGTDMACFAHFVSDPPAGAQGVNGGAALDKSGNFEGSKMYLDVVQRNPCSGTWNAAQKTMTVKCGGAGDLCTVVLKKSP